MLEEARKNPAEKGFEQLDWLQEYVHKNISGAKKTKLNLYAAIRSFYERNRASLPPDKSFRVQSDKPKTVGKLDLSSLRKILQGFAAQHRERAIFTIMFQSAMDLSSFAKFNTWKIWKEVEPQLDAGKLVKIIIPERKSNDQPFYTYFGTDAIEALKGYLRVRGEIKPSEPIFITSNGKPPYRTMLQKAFVGMAEKLGLFERAKPTCKRCGQKMELARKLTAPRHHYECTNGHMIDTKDSGINSGVRYGYNIHEMRDVFRSTLEKIPKHQFNTTCAEFWMGHNVDKLEYNKFYRDEEYVESQYIVAQPALNILSQPEKQEDPQISSLKTMIQMGLASLDDPVKLTKAAELLGIEKPKIFRVPRSSTPGVTGLMTSVNQEVDYDELKTRVYEKLGLTKLDETRSSRTQKSKFAHNGGTPDCGTDKGCQKVVGETELENCLKDGWRVVTALSSGRVVVSNE